MAASGLFIENGAFVNNHLTATSAEHLKLAPSKMLYDHVRAWAKETGHRFYHLGGGVGGETDSLFYFKAGFSKSTAPFYTCRMVLDEAKYKLLSDAAGKNGRSAKDSSDYFPAYRKPIE